MSLVCCCSAPRGGSMVERFGPRPGETFDDYCERLKAECRAKIATERSAAALVAGRQESAREYWWNRL